MKRTSFITKTSLIYCDYKQNTRNIIYINKKKKSLIYERSKAEEYRNVDGILEIQILIK